MNKLVNYILFLRKVIDGYNEPGMSNMRDNRTQWRMHNFRHGHRSFAKFSPKGPIKVMQSGLQGYISKSSTVTVQ